MRSIDERQDGGALRVLERELAQPVEVFSDVRHARAKGEMAEGIEAGDDAGGLGTDRCVTVVHRVSEAQRLFSVWGHEAAAIGQVVEVPEATLIGRAEAAKLCVDAGFDQHGGRHAEVPGKKSGASLGRDRNLGDGGHGCAKDRKQKARHNAGPFGKKVVGRRSRSGRG